MATGLKIENGDFVITNKEIELLNGYEKLKRDLLKFLLTEKENLRNTTDYYRYNPNFGTDINNKELYINMNYSTKVDLVKEKLGACLRYYIAVQESRSNISLDEIISNIDLLVFQTNDPSIIKIKIVVGTPSQTQQEIGTFNQTI